MPAVILENTTWEATTVHMRKYRWSMLSVRVVVSPQPATKSHTAAHSLPLVGWWRESEGWKWANS